MPQRRAMVRRRKRKKFHNRKYHSRNKINTVMIRGSRLQPDRVFVRLSYVDRVLHNSATPATFYRMNGINDPDTALGGSQPDRVFVRLSYVDRVLHNSATPATFYRMNGINDPDTALGGSQPVGYDQWSAFYRKFRVHASKIEIKFIQPSATSPANAIAVLTLPTATTTTNSLSFESLVANPYCRWDVLGPNLGASRARL